MKKTYRVNISDNESHIVIVPCVIVPHHRSAMSLLCQCVDMPHHLHALSCTLLLACPLL